MTDASPFSISEPRLRKALEARVRNLQKCLRARGSVDALLVSNIQNIRYLSGFTGTTAQLVAPVSGKAVFFTDFRYREQSAAQVRHCRRAEVDRGNYMGSVVDFLKKERLHRVGVEAGCTTLAGLENLKKLAAKSRLRFVPVSGAVEDLRLLKDAVEMDILREAHRIAAEALRRTVSFIRPGKRESEVAAELEYQMRKLGGEGISFDTIVGFGPRGAMPHCVASEGKIGANGFLVVDYGTMFHGYHSDTTRTFHIGRPPAWAKKQYQAVLDAQNRAIEGSTPGKPLKDIDAIARDFLTKLGWGREFGHGTGHGVGLDIHERPSVSQAGWEKVREGMAYTVEPGVYLPGKGGVRIEDVLLVHPGGRIENISPFPKDLKVL